MATKIPIGTAAYLTSFVDGQGAGASNYFTYAADHDTNYLLLRSTINTIIDEISAVSGPNATVALDLAIWDDDTNPITHSGSPSDPVSGTIGAASYEISRVGATLTVRKGQAFVNRQKVALIADLTAITSSGGAAARFIELDANGVVFIEEVEGTRAATLGACEWDGAAFIGDPVQGPDTASVPTAEGPFLPVFFDGDGWGRVQDRAVLASGTFGAFTYREGAARIRAIESFLSGLATGEEGETLTGPLALLPGAVGTPTLIFGDGVSVFDTTTGWFRPAADVWGWSRLGAELLRLSTNGLEFIALGAAGTPRIRRQTGGGIFFVDSPPGVAFSDGTTEIMRVQGAQVVGRNGTEAAPSYALTGDLGTGIFSATPASELSVSITGTEAFRFVAAALRSLNNGAVGAPAYSFTAETDTGMYRAGTDRLAFATGGNLRGEFDEAGNLDLPTNTGGIWNTTADSIGDAAAENIEWDAEERNIMGVAAAPVTDLPIPTGGDGLYLITLSVDWPTNTTGEREIAIRINTTDFDPVRQDAAGVGDIKQSTSTIVALVATDVVRGRAFQDSGGALTPDARIAIQKIA